MTPVAEKLRKIADASRREDGSDIPLGEQCREAADELERLQSQLTEARKKLGQCQDEANRYVFEMVLRRERIDRIVEGIRKLERRSFILVPAGNGVRAVKDSGGRWLEKFEVQDVLEAALAHGVVEEDAS